MGNVMGVLQGQKTLTGVFLSTKMNSLDKL